MHRVCADQDAFAKLPDGTVATLLKPENEKMLTVIDTVVMAKYRQARPWGTSVVSRASFCRGLVYIQRAVQADVILLDRVARGDQSAVGELYDLHSRLLFGILVRILNERAEAEEVLQEVFVQAWTRAGTYEVSRGTPAGWLCGIARNRAIDRLRARTRGVRTLEGVSAPPSPETPESLASTSERKRDVHLALDSLPQEQRELIERAYFAGSTQSEMATELGLPLGTVKTRVRAGLQTLRKLLERVPVDQ
ncbi:MAG: sigma-70 family RNA polymerase sigma factor [Acidobacteriota bacterium]|nr:sigma-70 family RNA polymerase sigma factor [Acidobacteriota bacterium]